MVMMVLDEVQCMAKLVVSVLLAVGWDDDAVGVGSGGADVMFGVVVRRIYLFLFFYLFIRHIHYYRQNVQLKTYIIRMARSYMATLRGAKSMPKTFDGQFVIAVEVVVEWYNDDQLLDVVVLVIDSVAMTVTMVLHGGGVYVIGVIVMVGW